MLRTVLIMVVLVVLVSVGWRHRNDAWVQGLLRPPEPAKVIQFDNGSVRDTLPRVAEDAASAAAHALALKNLPGTLHKRVRKSQVMYTDQPCPTGFTVEPVSGNTVTVLEGSAPKSNPAKAAPSDARKTLHDALDLSGNENLKDKMLERATNR